jgi:medium-chain acyl-[acyl-carrier-protein] hydrolase
MALFVSAVDEAIGDALVDRPFAVVGYSLGALQSFEWARRMRERGGPAPVCLIAAASRGPRVPLVEPRLSQLDTRLFLERVEARYGALDPRILADPMTANLIAHGMRADLEMLETYTYSPQLPLQCPILAIAGRQDTATPPEAVQEWAHETSSRFTFRLIDGGHFFLRSHATELLREVSAYIEPYIGG